MPMPPTSPDRSRARRFAAVGIAGLATTAGLTAVGEDASTFPVPLAHWLNAVLSPAIPVAAAYVLAALGLGALFRPLVPDATPAAGTIRGAMGLAAMLSLSHALGAIGLLGPVAAWTTVLAGLSLLAWTLSTPKPSAAPSPFSGWWPMLALVPACILLVAAANAPGSMWESEFGGYDALSYHLQLPQEWLASGRLEPLRHNVYSFLPGYVEAAFMHLGAMSLSPPRTGIVAGAIDPLSVRPAGMLAAAWPLVACQFLHAFMTLFAARCIHAAASVVVDRVTGLATANRVAPCIAAMVFLATPWSLVTGSLAYNEMPVVALVAAACALAAGAASDRRAEWVRIFAGCALLVGGACGAKPTALLFGGAPVALLLLVNCPPRHLLPATLSGAVVGVAMLAPWMLRNAAHAANPVFPFAASLFPNATGGTGHWTAEQVARFANGHAFDGSLLDALRLCVLPDPSDPAGVRHRGMLHPQWFAFFPLAAIAAARACVAGSVRGRLAAALALGLVAQVALWLTTTHVQSRFLMPLMPSACMLLALALASLPSARAAAVIGVAATLLQLGASVACFASQRGGRPNMLLSVTPADRAGETQRAYLAANPREFTPDLLDSLGPEHAVNLALPREAVVTLVGGATPLYLTRKVQYNTTWDAWPDLSAALAAAAKGEQRFLLVDFAEIERLSRSGFIEPGWSSSRMSEWIARHGRPVKAWQELGQVLVLVEGPGDKEPDAR
jgi:hypothetical protein